jgi:hypothetical protein
MPSRPLTTARRRIEELAVATGEYIVVCRRTGTRPVPVAGKRFPDRKSADTAAWVATEYRATLRRYDGRTPRHDFVIRRESAAEERGNSHVPWLPVSLGGGETV